MVGSAPQDQPTQPIPLKRFDPVTLATHENQYVQIEGTAGDRNDEPMNNTRAFRFFGYYNSDEIWVRTDKDWPVKGKRYIIRGTIIRQAIVANVEEDIIVETSRDEVEAPVNNTTTGTDTTGTKTTNTDTWKLVAAGIAGLALIAGIVLMAIPKRNQ